MEKREYRFIKEYNSFITSKANNKEAKDLTPGEREIYLNILKSEFIPKPNTKSYFDWELQFRNTKNSLGIEQKEFKKVMEKYKIKYKGDE